MNVGQVQAAVVEAVVGIDCFADAGQATLLMKMLGCGLISLIAFFEFF